MADSAGSLPPRAPSHGVAGASGSVSSGAGAAGAIKRVDSGSRMGGYIGAGVLKEYQDEYALPLAPASGTSTMVRSKTVGDVTSLSLTDTKSWAIAAAADKGTPRLGGTPHFGPLGGLGRLPDGLSGAPGTGTSGVGGSSNSLSALSPLGGGGSASRLSDGRSSSRFAITAPAAGAAGSGAASATGVDSSSDDVGISLDSGGVSAVSSASTSAGAAAAAATAFPLGASPRAPSAGVGGSALLHSLLRSGIPVTTATLTLPASSVPGALPAASLAAATGGVASPTPAAVAANSTASASASPSASSLSAPGAGAAVARRGTPSPSVGAGRGAAGTPPASGLRSSASGGSALASAVNGAGHAHHVGAAAAAAAAAAAGAGPADGSSSTSSAAPSPSHLDISLAVGKPVSVPIVIKPAAIAAAAVSAAAASVASATHGHVHPHGHAAHGHGHGHVHGPSPAHGVHAAGEGPSPSSAFGAAVSGAASYGAPIPGSGAGVITMTNRQASLRREGKLVLSMVGLPARGKTAIARRLKRHLTWAGYRTEIFNVGNYRRRFLGASQPAAFFDPANQEAVAARHEMARLALEDMTASLADDSVDIAIFDATNSTIERRRWLATALREREGALSMRFQLVFIESICSDTSIIRSNVAETKLKMPDYREVDEVTAVNDFLARIAHYASAYEPLDEAKEGDTPFIKLIDVGRQLIANRIQGYLNSKIMFFLANHHITPRPIWLSRHGESEFNVAGRIGGDSLLSPRGYAYALKLGAFIRDRYPVRGEASASGSGASPSPSGGAGVAGAGADGAAGPLLASPAGSASGSDGGAEDDSELVVWTSMLRRTAATATHLGRPIIRWKELDEIDAGICDGLTYEEVAAKYPDEYRARAANKYRYRYPRGESYEDIAHRLEPVVIELMRTRAPLLIVSHQAVLRVLYAYLTDKDPDSCPEQLIPLHTVIELTPRAYGCDEVRHELM